MNNLKKTLATLLLSTGAAIGQGLDLEYAVSDIGGGIYEYRFFLSPDDGWEPGMGWAHVVFGIGAPWPTLTDWFGDPDSLPVGPWDDYASSAGADWAAYSFWPVTTHWIPASGDETLVWKGTAAVDLEQGELLFGTRFVTVGGAAAIDRAVADRIDFVCDPDLDGDGELNVFDFLAFINLFEVQDPLADFDGDGEFTVLDFLAFQNAFDTGCP
ncbi:MAG: hypothetical protein NCW75_04725 [Phycisphaera sp.]|nr:MAG: hypothetical protein NCW75_04725 [Phycisphaera sp.]